MGVFAVGIAVQKIGSAGIGYAGERRRRARGPQNERDRRSRSTSEVPGVALESPASPGYVAARIHPFHHPTGIPRARQAFRQKKRAAAAAAAAAHPGDRLTDQQRRSLRRDPRGERSRELLLARPHQPLPEEAWFWRRRQNQQDPEPDSNSRISRPRARYGALEGDSPIGRESASNNLRKQKASSLIRIREQLKYAVRLDVFLTPTSTLVSNYHQPSPGAAHRFHPAYPPFTLHCSGLLWSAVSSAPHHHFGT